MEKLLTLQNQVAGDAIEIEITFRHPHTDQPIRISGMVGILPEETYPTAPSQTDPGLLDRLQRIREWERKNLPQWGSRIAQDLFRYLGTHTEPHHASTVKEIVLATGYSERAIRKQLQRFGEHGWITRTQSDVDRRNAHIQTTERFRVDYACWLMLHQHSQTILDR